MWRHGIGDTRIAFRDMPPGSTHEAPAAQATGGAPKPSGIKAGLLKRQAKTRRSKRRRLAGGKS